MKNSVVLVMAIMALTAFSSDVWSQDKKEQDKSVVANNMEVTINIPTIKCGSCATTVTEALKSLKGVEQVKVNRKTKKVTVTYVDSKVKVNDLELAIAKAGYDANDVKRDKAAYENLDSCCK